jgi:hypothetical protein
MAGKTIRLLEIVYGAELKRLFAEAEQILQSLKNFSTDLAQSDPQAFADQARYVLTLSFDYSWT